MRAELAQSIAEKKKTIEQQATDARAALEVESRSIAREIGSRVLSRPISDGQMN